MEIEKQNGANLPDKPVRILSGKPEVVEHEIGRLWSNYAPISWNWAVAKDEVILSVVLISHTEVRKAQIAQAANMQGIPRR